jgi:AraC-like DNA-binding protein
LPLFTASPGLACRKVTSMLARVVRYESADLQLELAFSPPHETLRPYLREYVGGYERSTTPICRRELPSTCVPLIINFGPGIRERKAGSAEWREHRTFTAGIHEAFTLVESTGPGHGIQVNFTALGARLFYDRPLLDLANRTVDLPDILGSSADRLTARLVDADSWDARFSILDREIAARVHAARQPSRAVVWAWRELVKSAGQLKVTSLAREIGWSERHFAVRFRDEFGLAPKVFARTLRFARAVRMLTNRYTASLADVALMCGYYDQAHFTRDFHAFAGITPSGLVETRLPQQAGFRAEQ